MPAKYRPDKHYTDAQQELLALETTLSELFASQTALRAEKDNLNQATLEVIHTIEKKISPGVFARASIGATALGFGYVGMLLGGPLGGAGFAVIGCAASGVANRVFAPVKPVTISYQGERFDEVDVNVSGGNYTIIKDERKKGRFSLSVQGSPLCTATVTLNFSKEKRDIKANHFRIYKIDQALKDKTTELASLKAKYNILKTKLENMKKSGADITIVPRFDFIPAVLVGANSSMQAPVRRIVLISKKAAQKKPKR